MTKKFVLFILTVGIVFRLILSHDYNFIFNMDNARDMVDVREMMELKKPRLIGPTTAIEGFYNGPGWYYLLSVPYFLTEGDPYGSILMEIMLWAIGGYFLLILVNKYYGILALLAVSIIWIASNFILLATQYAFNPNPVLLLTPAFIFYLIKYLESGKLKYSLIIWFLTGIFLHFEIAAALFLPLVIVANVLLGKHGNYLKSRAFGWGLVAFSFTLLPQILFDLKNNFQLSKSLLLYKSGTHGSVDLNPLSRLIQIWQSFYDTFLPTLMNFQTFQNVIIILFGICLGMVIFKKQKIELLTQICLSMLGIFVLLNIPLRVDLMRWHLNAILISAIILIGFTISYLGRINFPGKLTAFLLVVTLFGFALGNVKDYIMMVQKGDPGNSIINNELSAIDYTYQEAGGKNFKVYTYLPSVIDYPYQYLYWWRGLKTYGYLPEDYAYLPNKPEYIRNKARLDTGNHPDSSELTFLIKEPEDGRRHLWENSFKHLELLKIATFGAITVETRR